MIGVLPWPCPAVTTQALRERDAEQQSDTEPDAELPQGAPKQAAQHLPTRCAEGTADADLACTLGDAEGDHAIQTGTGEQQSKHAEYSETLRDHTFAQRLAAHHSGEIAHPVQRRVGIHRAHDFTEPGGERKRSPRVRTTMLATRNGD